MNLVFFIIFIVMHKEKISNRSVILKMIYILISTIGTKHITLHPYFCYCPYFLRLTLIPFSISFIQRRKVKDFFIKFTKKSHFADFLTKHTLDFVLHCLLGGLAEMHTDDIGGLADLLSDSRARGVVSCGIVHSKSSCK